MIKKWLNLLLVAGTNRNVGKTTFICKLIEATSKYTNVTAIKITPHFHELTNTLQLIHQSDNLIISKELSTDIAKDSSKMLAAGANLVLYIQSTDENLPKAMQIIEPFLSKNGAIVCESAALRKHLEPGLFIVMSLSNISIHNKNYEHISNADSQLHDYKYSITNFMFNNGTWLLQ